MPPNRLLSLGNWSRRGVALLSGIAMSLGQAPFGFPWLVVVAAPLLYLLLEDRHWKAGFGVGWVAGLGYFALTLHWIVEPFLVDVARHGWMAPFAVTFLASGLALFWGAAFALAVRLTEASGARVVALAALWTLAEVVRSYIFTGFPWGLVGYIWGETPVIQLLAYIGPFGLTFATFMLALTPVVFPGRQYAAIAVTLFAFGTLWFAGSVRVPDTALVGDTTVRLVQPNALQEQKWQPEMMQVFFDRQLASTAAQGDVDVVIWPEVAVPYLVDERSDLNAAIGTAAGTDAHVVLGGRRVEGTDTDARWFNSAFVLDSSGALVASYDKHHLVPFGEYLPFPAFFDLFNLKALAQNAGRFSAGDKSQPVRIDGIPDAQILICYEAIFPGLIQRGADRPRWVLHLTNDAWFGDFSGPYQHLAQARFRAVESGLPIARSANTGVSAMIDPYGRVTASLPLNTDGFVDAALPAALAPTLFARTGPVPGFIAVLLVLGAAVARGRKTVKERTLHG